MKHDKNGAARAFMANMPTYIREYAVTHYPRLTVDKVFVDERGAFACCGLGVSGQQYMVRLRLPRNAPPGARPLFDSLYLGDKLVWRYVDNYKPNVPWGEQRRIHLCQFETMFVMVHVVAAFPQDGVVRVSYVDDKDFTPELATALRIHIARLWGMVAVVTKAERRVLAAIEKAGMLS